MPLDARSERNLTGVHPDLAAVVRRGYEIYAGPGLMRRFIVTEGVRTMARQRELVAKGASKTLRSRHLTGHAIDVCVLTPTGKENWANEAYVPIARAMKRAAEEIGLTVEWGGDWKSFCDTPHFQLPWATYPAEDHVAHARRMAPDAPEPARDTAWRTVVTDSAPPADDSDPPSDTRPPIASMAESTTGNAAVATGGMSLPQMGVAVGNAASKSSTPGELAVNLMCEVLFWTAIITVCTSLYIWLERRAKLHTWGI